MDYLYLMLYFWAGGFIVIGIITSIANFGEINKINKRLNNLEKRRKKHE